MMAAVPEEGNFPFIESSTIVSKRQKVDTIEEVKDEVKEISESQEDDTIEEVIDDVNERPNSIEPFKGEVIKAIQYFGNIMCRRGFQSSHEVSLLFSYMPPAPDNFDNLIKNEEELLEFFVKFPQIFRIIDGQIVLINWIVFYLNQQKWLLDLMYGSQFTQNLKSNNWIVACIVQFYFNKLFVNCNKLPLDALFKCRPVPEIVRNKIKGIVDLKQLILTFPNIFVLTEDLVSLTETKISYRCMFYWITSLLHLEEEIARKMHYEYRVLAIEKKLVDDEHFKNQIATNEALGYYYNKLLYYGSANSSHEITKCWYSTTPSIIQGLTENWNELKIFLLHYPLLFIIVNDCVYLSQFLSQTELEIHFSDTLEIGLNYSVHEKDVPELLKNIDPVKLTVKFYYNFVNNTFSRTVGYPIVDLFDHVDTAPFYVKALTSNPREITNFLIKHIENIEFLDDRCYIFPLLSKPFVENSSKKLTFKEEIDNTLLSKENLTYKDVDNAFNVFNYIAHSGGTMDIYDLLKFEGFHGCEQQLNLRNMTIFLSNFPNIFYIMDRTIVLKDVHVEIEKNAAQFYYDFCKLMNQPMELQMLVKYREWAPSEVQEIVKNEGKLCILLLKFPKLFNLIENIVLIQLEQNQDTENDNISNYNQTNRNYRSSIDAEKFFIKAIEDNKFPKIMSIYELELLNRCQNFPIARGPRNLLEFLKSKSQKFIVTNENVMLTEKIPMIKINTNYNSKYSQSSLLILNFIDQYTRKGYFKCNIDNLYRFAGRFFCKSNKSLMFKSCGNFSLFLSQYRQVFYIYKKKLLNIMASVRDKIEKSEDSIEIHNMDYYITDDYGCNETYENENEGSLGDKIKTGDYEVVEEIDPPDVENNGSKGAKENKSDSTVDEETYCLVEEDNNNEEEENPTSSVETPNEETDCFIDEDYNAKEKNLTSFNEATIEETYCSVEEDYNTQEESSTFSDKEFDFSINTDFSNKTTLNQSKYIREALDFINGELWKNDELKILNISDLFVKLSNSSWKIIANDVMSLKFFLVKYPDDFVISDMFVMAKKNKLGKDESIPLLVFNFFDLYTQNYLLNVDYYYRIARNFLNPNKSLMFKSPDQLYKFFRMFPDVFSFNGNCLLNRSRIIESQINLENDFSPSNSYVDQPINVEWEKSVLTNTQIIENQKHCIEITKKILVSEKLIALDCEGINFGLRTGRVTLLQIGLANKKIYLFDIFKVPSMLRFGGLKEILESDTILKVIHDSFNDATVLFWEFGIKLTNIFDTRVANSIIDNLDNVIVEPLQFTGIALNKLCQKYSAPLNIKKDKIRSYLIENKSLWEKRPLTTDMISYAALDVASLVHIFEKMCEKYIDTLDLVIHLSYKYSRPKSTE